MDTTIIGALIGLGGLILMQIGIALYSHATMRQEIKSICKEIEELKITDKELKDKDEAFGIRLNRQSQHITVLQTKAGIDTKEGGEL